ncbi:hypothetical protein [Planomicrobium okeanokoites]|uniref:Lipoprotein n=1 Tax=Planomicrobium okeanokoites TaxID=244 RepID=A0ABV7KSI3_PLAOK|nr:hypothetical protein [Planomicrobium okeanokoites]TAA70286.1 hypothetical protein D2910_07505 [Planomicrobium okeanokoites]
MGEKFIIIVAFIVAALLLYGCGTADEQAGDLADQSEPIHSQSQTPPALELKIGDETIQTYRGSYSWSYYDSEEKSMSGIEAESIPPHEMISTDNARKVDRHADVALEFGERPLSYQLFVWDEAGNRTAYPVPFELSEHEGPTLFEIFAHWEQGQASYVVALDVE